MNRRTGFSLATFAAVLLLLSSFLPSVFAQDREDYDHDPPTRVGRVGYTQGTVSFQPGGDGDWLDAVPNRPLSAGDNLWVDRGARAEVQIGSSSIRLGAQTSMTLSDLENNVTQLRLSMGSLFLHIRHVGSDETFEIDTPNLAFSVTEPGEYRVDVNENGDQTNATVWRGNAEITGGGSSYRLGDGQQGTFSGTDQLSYDVGGIRQDDDFSRWSLDRDRRADRVRSAQYVSPEMTGYQDLDEYGSWHNEGQYGNVWTPTNVSQDWAPYRNGHWAYVSPWGWTWMEDEPWGFAPFHYGRWAHAGRGWFWVPGPVAVAPVYSPALVAFVGGGGGGGGFSISVGFGGGRGGGVGWFPLGPGDVYVPPYRTSRRYVENVNVTNTRVNVVNVTNVYNNVTVNHVNNVTYVNQSVNNSVTVVNHDTFVNARPVNSNVIRVDARQMQQLQHAPVTHEVAQQIQPQRQSVMGAARPVQAEPPKQVMVRQVVATRQPPVVNRAAPVQGMARPAAAPEVQIRKVDAAPRGQAQALQSGARGSTAGPANGQGRPANAPANNAPGNNAPGNNAPANAGRPVPPGDNRSNGAPGKPGENQQPNQGNRPGENVPRPGAPQNAQPNAAPNAAPQNGRPGERPGTPNNAPQPNNVPVRPNTPEVNRPTPDANRPGAPDNNRPTRDVPRPGKPEQQSPQGNAQPERPQPNAPNARPPQPNTPTARPPQPDNQPDRARPNDRVPQPNRPQEQAPQTQTPQNRERPAVPQPDVRREPPPRPTETRPEPPPPQTRRDTPPPVRNEPAPRPPETRNAPPPQREQQPQRDTRTPEQRQKDKEKEQNPPKSK